MRRIILSDGREFATNEHDGGVFCRRPDGNWQQWAGNSQTPQFRTAQQFRAYLRTHFSVTGARIVVMWWGE